ncbi:MAG: hypothetical protein LBR44_00090 [Clostridiales Family XIII bacterium]|jgi:pyrroline-5-carboxylate reductase|nr:hypothetical protein [Clostridiales Family XIII bacterium]
MYEGKTVFVNGGKSAETLIKSLMHNGGMPADKIHVVNEKLAGTLAQTCGLTEAVKYPDAMYGADIVIVDASAGASSVIPPLSVWLKEEAVVLFLDADEPLEQLIALVGGHGCAAQAVLSPLAAVGRGYSGIVPSAACGEAQIGAVVSLLEGIGKTMVLEEGRLPVFRALSKAEPALYLSLLTAMGDAGVYVGFNREDARSVTMENMLVTAKLLQETGKHPLEITDTWTSPSGVTIEALYETYKTCYEKIVLEGVEAALAQPGAAPK